MGLKLSTSFDVRMMRLKIMAMELLEFSSAGIDFFPSAPITKKGKTVCEIKYF